MSRLVKTFFTLLSFLVFTNVNGQNVAATNEIYRDANTNLGVKSADGKTIIDPIYRGIFNIYSNSKLILPPNAKLDPILLDYYRVRDSLGRQSIFNSDGEIVFEFMETFNLVFDPHTQTVVTSIMLQDNRVRYSLYNMDNEKILDSDYKRIGYVLNSDLLVLEKERREIYLFNPFTKSTLGPYDVVNVYDEHFDPTMGLPNIKHNKLTKQVGIGVRINDREWGFVDNKGNIVLPIVYKNLKIIPYSMYENEILKADKPDDVNFVFYGYSISGERKRFFIDEDLNIYEYDTSQRTSQMSGKITRIDKRK